MKNKPELGDEVECNITGFRGIINMTVQCLTGCDRVSVQAPMTKDGKYGDCYYIDEAAVRIIKKGKVKAQSVQSDIAKGGPATRVR